MAFAAACWAGVRLALGLEPPLPGGGVVPPRVGLVSRALIWELAPAFFDWARCPCFLSWAWAFSPRWPFASGGLLGPAFCPLALLAFPPPWPEPGVEAVRLDAEDEALALFAAAAFAAASAWPFALVCAAACAMPLTMAFTPMTWGPL